MSDQRKFFCEFCRVLIPYNHKDISAHEKTQKHKRNKDRNLQDLNRKAKREKEKNPAFRNSSSLAPKQKEEVVSMMNEINKRAFQQYEADCVKYGQEQNPDLKPELIELPPLENDPEKNQNLFGNVWSLRVDTDTGKLCFYNKISGKVQFQKPVGLKLTAKEKEIWESQNANAETSDGLFGPAISKLNLAGNIGQWEVVDPSEDYFKKNAYHSSDEESSDLDPELEKLEKKLEKIEEKEKNLENTETEKKETKEKIEIILPKTAQEEKKDIIDEVLEYKDNTNYGKSALKLKNERLIKLAEENFELGVFEKPTYLKKQEKSGEDQIKENICFKKRKMNNGKGIIIKPESESP